MMKTPRQAPFGLSFRTACGLILLFLLALPAERARCVDLVKDARALAKLFVEADDVAGAPGKVVPKPNQIRKAAPGTPGMVALAVEDLNDHVEQMSGVRLEVVKTSDPQQVTGPGIVIGALAKKLGCDVPATKWKEGYHILSNDDRVLIAGESPRGISHGIYALLRIMGCDWVMPGKLGEIIPKKKTLSVPAMDLHGAPDFGVRNFWYRGESFIVTKEEKEDYAQWTRRQRLGKSEVFADDKEGHYWDTFIWENRKEFDADPMMLALVRLADGALVRRGPQIETTNPKVIQLMAAGFRKTFQTKGWPNDKAVTLAIGPADGDGFSISPESLALGSSQREPMMGGRDVTDLVVKLANDVLDQVGKEFPNLSFGYYVYSVHSGFPSRYMPNPRIVPVFAPISYSRLHSTEDPHSKSRAYYRQIVKQWSALSKAQGNQLQVYEYNWNLADNMLPFTRLKMLGEDIPFYHRMNFVGLTLESTKAWAINGPHDYAAAQLAWNSSLDWRSLLKEYCLKTFGAAAPMMERYYLRLSEVQSRAGQEAGSYYSAPLVFDDAYIATAQKDLDTALSQALNPDERLRTEAAALPLETLRYYLAWRRAMGGFEFGKANEALDAIIAGWQKQLDRNSQFVAREVPRYVKSFLRDSTVAALKYSTAPYEIIWKFPDALSTALDPSGDGKTGNIAFSDMKDAEHLPRASAEEANRYSSSPYHVVWKFPDALPTAFDPTIQGEKMGLAAPSINDQGWLKTLTSPGGWGPQGLGSYREGAVWYRVRFELPKEDRKQPIGLFLGGFDDEARVWVNGKAVGSSAIKRPRPSVFNLTGAIREEGENVVAIQIVRHSKSNHRFAGGMFGPCFIFAGPQVKLAEKSEDSVQRPAPAPSIVPESTGSEISMASPELDDSGWMKTRTWSSTWDAQGLGFYREGTVWYRVRFELPEGTAKKPIGLFLGGFDDEARVWVNGKAVGSSGFKFSSPAVFDLTGAISNPGKNVVAIQIVRNSRLNEIFTGGIFQPCFVFSGPQVAPAEKKGDPEFRVLPGGEQERVPSGKKPSPN